jgi:hypothetical protein
MKQLRLNQPWMTEADSFSNTVQQLQQQEGYQLASLVLQDTGAVVAVAGYKVGESLANGRELYVNGKPLSATHLLFSICQSRVAMCWTVHHINSWLATAMLQSPRRSAAAVPHVASLQHTVLRQQQRVPLSAAGAAAGSITPACLLACCFACLPAYPYNARRSCNRLST